jgi:hypothetical protein
MSKMNDVDIKFNELEERLEGHEAVMSAIVSVLLAFAKGQGDFVHDESVLVNAKLKFYGEMIEHLSAYISVEEPTESEGSDDNVVNLFEEE